MTDPGRDSLGQLATAAGLQVRWRDAYGKEHHAPPDVLRAVLHAMGIPCANPAQCNAALEQLGAEAQPRKAAAAVSGSANVCIVRVGRSVVLQRQGSLHYRLQLEGGASILGTARDLGNGFVAISGIQQPGYHQLDMGGVHCTVAVVPKRCPSVSELLALTTRVPSGPVSARWSASRPWVLNAQVYGLCRQQGLRDRLHREGGQAIQEAEASVLPGWQVGGDFTLVGQLAREAGDQGALGLAISPIHAMFSADRAHYSPYSPSSRRFLNVMYADPAAVLPAEILAGGRDVVPDGASSPHTLLDKDGCLDWPAIQGMRLKQLRTVFEHFEAVQPEASLEDFEAFRHQGGEALDNHACYEALHAHFCTTLGPGHGWRDWPAAYQDPQGEAVRRHRREHATDVRFHSFLQWLASRNLADAHQRARSATPLGLIADMAVGTDPRGSDAWSRQDQIMTGLSVGAPPDIFQPHGQNWGLTAFSPRALQQQGYAGYIDTLRAVLAHAGGMRVDHIMGLSRLWLIPDGASAAEGVYLGYPRDDLLDLLVLEGWRHQALIVGENLGTVPEDFNAALHERGILGMSVLWFEQHEMQPPSFKAPQDWPSESMAMVSTHDLPTLRGWWLGRDIDWRDRQGDMEGQQVESGRRAREEQKAALWRALQNAGLAASEAPVPAEVPDTQILALVASTPAALMSVALEDVLGLVEQPNLPGAGDTVAEPERHPNWRRSYPLPIKELLSAGEAPRRLAALHRSERAGRLAAPPGRASSSYPPGKSS